MLRFFRKEQAKKAAENTERLRQPYEATIEAGQPQGDSRVELEVLRKRVATLTHKAMRGGLNEIERIQIMHEADLLWTRLASEMKHTRQQAEKVS